MRYLLNTHLILRLETKEDKSFYQDFTFKKQSEIDFVRGQYAIAECHIRRSDKGLCALIRKELLPHKISRLSVEKVLELLEPYFRREII